MTLREWIPVWLTTYKLGTIKERSYHQLELLVRKFPDDLLDMELAEIRPLHLQSSTFPRLSKSPGRASQRTRRRRL